MKIVLDQLRKTYGEKTAVDVPHFEIESGTLFGLVGNNGAGKSTLFRLMLDLSKPDTGTVTIGGTNVALTEAWKGHVGAFLDESFLIDYLTPMEFFRFVARVSGISDSDLSEQLRLLRPFTKAEIEDEGKYIRDLSSGLKQKVGIVAALLQQPRVLILDEPFNFLDPGSQIALKRLLVEYNRKRQATILVSSHNLQHTVDISRRIALMERGRLIRDLPNEGGSAKEALESYFESLS
ncbi:MAG: ABC transporter ATP-binding protein [Prevotellaceae bacterium]|nr:ABC transporter ATP-binding protein [Prevotellaceae bacterium]